jgi:hypothetical protein
LKSHWFIFFTNKDDEETNTSYTLKWESVIFIQKEAKNNETYEVTSNGYISLNIV